MAELLIQCEGRPDQVVPLGEQPVTIGRSEDCEVFIPEKKASRRHARIRLHESGDAVAEDLGSSNGTWCRDPDGSEQRLLRRVLEDGAVLRIGDTRITFRAVAPSAATEKPLVSGTLDLRPAGPLPASTSPAVDETQAIPDEVAERYEEPLFTGPPPPDRRGLIRALIVCGVAVAVFVGVELYLGGRARKKTERKNAHLQALQILEHLDAGAARFEEMRDEFALAHPNSPDLLTLDRYLEQLREREEHALQIHAQLETLLGRIDVVPASELRFQLMQLLTQLPGDEDFALRVARALDGLDRRRAEEDMDALRELETRVETLLTGGRPAAAARLVEAYGNTRPGVNDEVGERWQRLRTRVAGIVASRFDTVWTRVEAEPDPARRRALLADAYDGLAGSKQGVRIRDRLRTAASMAAPRRPGAGAPAAGGAPPGATPPGTPPTPAPPSETQLLLARAREAEEKLLARDWVAGRAVLAELLTKVDSGLLHAEWQTRVAEVDQLLGLVQALAERTDAERKPRVKLSTGTWTVVAANPADVTLEGRREGSKVFGWGELAGPDVLVLLRPKKPTREDRHAVAVVAANVGERQAFIDALIPVYDAGGDLTATNGLVARHLYGLAAAPEGGYRHYKGEILDNAGYERRLEQERIAWLRTEADRLLALIAKEAAFKKLAKLVKMRDDLDERRRYALLAIFNTTHYPYPANKGSNQYQSVQMEIDRRVAKVREIWDDPYKVRIKRAGQLAKRLDAWDAVIAEMQRKKLDVADLQKRIEAYTLYITEEPLTVRTYFRDKEEAELQAYNRWVMQTYNPARREVARDAEWRQVRITNDYRMLMGYTAVVKPGPAAYEAIDRDNVVKILDAAEIQKLWHLRALRVDNRLVISARLHSEDMSKRGYFAHQAPPNPATGEGATGPADRMMKQGYRGYGYSENIATSSNPQQAHTMWCHSSGHHRNILSNWTDLGSGVGGRNFTQNFAMGGGARPEIKPDTSIREREGRLPGGQRRPRGQ